MPLHSMVQARTGFYSFQNEKSYFFIKIRRMACANNMIFKVLRLDYYATGQQLKDVAFSL